MNATRIIRAILVVTLILCAGGLGISCWGLHRMFAPHPRMVEDANSISKDTTDHFVQWLGHWPAQVARVYEHDSRGLHPNVLLRFTVPIPAEYDVWKQSIARLEGESVTAFPRISERDAGWVKSWWSPPKAGVRKFANCCYVAFDDPNQTAYVSYANSH